MCGIVGAIWTDPERAIDAAALERMTALVAHRGPDDAGFYQSELHWQPPLEPRPGVALGHRRLSIIDVAGSHQPLANEDGTIRLIFNGEIYNYRELRRRLEGTGHTFRTAGDAETIVHLYEDEGPEFVRRLSGMFALAIWDGPRRRLVLARDRLGKKPLLYRTEEQRVLFASELKCLLQRAGRAARYRSRRGRRVSYLSIRAPSEYDFPRYSQAAARALRRVARRPVFDDLLLAARFQSRGLPPASGIYRRVAVAHDRRRATPVAKRRAAGGVSFRRSRFDDRRGLDEPVDEPARENVFNRIFVGRV